MADAVNPAHRTLNGVNQKSTVTIVGEFFNVTIDEGYAVERRQECGAAEECLQGVVVALLITLATAQVALLQHGNLGIGTPALLNMEIQG